MFKRNDRPKQGFNALSLGVSFVFASSCLIGTAYADTSSDIPSSTQTTEISSAVDSSAVSTTLAAGDLYVAPNGNVSNPGTISSPTTLEAALTQIAPGKTIYLRGGNYTYSSTITVQHGNNGSKGSLKGLVAYGSEKPVLDFSSLWFKQSGTSA